MKDANWLIIPIAATIPLIISFIWYQPKVFGTALAKVTGQSIEQITNYTAKRIGFIYLFGLLMAYIITACSVHQYAVFQLFMFEPSLTETGSEFNGFLSDFYGKYGDRHRSFFHGVIHGAEASLLFGLASLGISTFMEGAPMKRMWIHLGYFVLCGSIMGGLVCAFL